MNDKKIAVLSTLVTIALVFIMITNFRLMFNSAKISKLEKRVDNLQKAMQTKDKELEAGLRNSQNGLMLKIDYIEKQMGEVK